MSNEVDGSNIDDRNILDDRDIIKDGHIKRERSNVSKTAAVLVLLGVCGYLVFLTISTDKKKSVELPKEGVIKQTELFYPTTHHSPASPDVDESKQVPLPKIELPTPKKTNHQKFDNSLLEAAQRSPVLAYSSKNKEQEHVKNNDVSLSEIDNKIDTETQHFNNILKPTNSQGVHASTLGNRNYIIAMGASIPCILETAINSDQLGFVSCIVARDILSDNGRVVLLDKGTQIVGEYRSGLKKGQNRLFILWNRAKTPNGVIITLASPATDFLGRSGVNGYVDNHWLERIGSALLVSIVRDATRYVNDRFVSNQEAKNSDTISSGQNIANVIAESYTNIPPTLIKNQGEMINVFVARDLDFSNVYKLKVIDNKKHILNRAMSGNFYKNSAVTLK
ncbi:type IV secretion system protein VirB10 [Bartonella sp. CB175]|uniref:type IV secretion system protein VirB10 n=1 Tax=Bartonella sp. CB175 TaxID=3112256 RepID=UPI00300DF5B0